MITETLLAFSGTAHEHDVLDPPIATEQVFFGKSIHFILKYVKKGYC